MLHFLREHAASTIKRARPEIRPGYTVRVHERIHEGGKERIQMFEGLVIAQHKGQSPTDRTFTVRRIASGIGVERVFCLASPTIEKIDVKKVAKIRRSKLFFLRGRRGKGARLAERFTTADEFAIAAHQEPVAEQEDDNVAEEQQSADTQDTEESTADALAQTQGEEEKKETV
jgi:large subunit ribosomal protein L19